MVFDYHKQFGVLLIDISLGQSLKTFHTINQNVIWVTEWQKVINLVSWQSGLQIQYFLCRHYKLEFLTVATVMLLVVLCLTAHLLNRVMSSSSIINYCKITCQTSTEKFRVCHFASFVFQKSACSFVGSKHRISHWTVSKSIS